MYMGLVYHTVCLFAPQLLLVLSVPTHGGIMDDLGCCLHSKMVYLLLGCWYTN